MSASQHTVLLVEDTEDDVFLMKRALKNAGILNPLHVVEDGQEAMDYLAGLGIYANRTQYPYPNIIFLDLKLPDKSGFDVLAWLKDRADLPRPKIFVLSSSNMPNDLKRVAELGAMAYLVKPPTQLQFKKLTQDYAIEWLTTAGG